MSSALTPIASSALRPPPVRRPGEAGAGGRPDPFTEDGEQVSDPDELAVVNGPAF